MVNQPISFKSSSPSVNREKGLLLDFKLEAAFFTLGSRVRNPATGMDQALSLHTHTHTPVSQKVSKYYFDSCYAWHPQKVVFTKSHYDLELHGPIQFCTEILLATSVNKVEWMRGKSDPLWRWHKSAAGTDRFIQATQTSSCPLRLYPSLPSMVLGF